MMLVLVVLRAKARNVWIRLGMSVFTILSSPLLLNLFVQIRICHICHAYMRIEIQVLQFNYRILKKKKNWGKKVLAISTCSRTKSSERWHGSSTEYRFHQKLFRSTDHPQTPKNRKWSMTIPKSTIKCHYRSFCQTAGG